MFMTKSLRRTVTEHRYGCSTAKMRKMIIIILYYTAALPKVLVL